MNKRYDILLGLALLVAVGTGYFYNQNRYFHVTRNEEISESIYRNLETRKDWRVEWHYNYEAGFTAGLLSMGVELVLFGLIGKNRKRAT